VRPQIAFDRDDINSLKNAKQHAFLTEMFGESTSIRYLCNMFFMVLDY